MFAGLMSRCTIPLRVRGLERVGDLDARARGRRSTGSGPPRDPLLQRLPVEQLHDDERLPVVLADVVDRADVRMVQRRGGAGLALEALQRLPGRGELGRQELERDLAAQPRVLGLVDDAHAAAADPVEDAVVGQRWCRSRKSRHPSRLDRPPMSPQQAW